MSTEREQVIALLRKAADLVEASEAVPVPDVTMRFWLRESGDAPATVTAIMTALPGGWKAEQANYGGTDFLKLESEAGQRHLRVIVPAALAGTEEGTRVVTEWRPLPEITALLEQPGGEQ